MSSDYLTAPEIARILRVDVAKVRSWITSGKLQAIDVSAQGRSGHSNPLNSAETLLPPTSSPEAPSNFGVAV